jgi:hypothetical protein
MIAFSLLYVTFICGLGVYSGNASLLRPSPNRQLQSSVGNVIALQLINADTDSPIRNLTNGTTINIAPQTIANFSVQAIVANGSVGSIRFGYNNYTNFLLESTPPFALCGDRGGNYKTCPDLTIGRHTITATPFSNRSGIGTQGVPFQVSFTISCKKPEVRQCLVEALDDF